MAKIIQLDDILSNKIAAGEVIERPANVVKELVENSIDAGSDKIDVIIEDGGLGLIQVIDNGEGMERSDALLCFSRHATSKIKDDQDLFSIETLGFRGEAIPSIASISKFTLTTTNVETTIVSYLYGKLVDVATSNGKKGTNIIVEQLFQNVPARLKYMKSSHTEFAHIQTLIEKLAMSYPHIKFTLSHNRKLVFQSVGNNQLLQTIGSIYGLNIAKNMIKTKFENHDFVVEGYISKIDVTRSSKKDIVTMVNHRVVRNLITIDAINRAYRNYLSDQRFPIAIIDIIVDPYLVDVNVHPSKLEVRFSKENDLRELVYQGIKDTLAKHDLTYQVQPTIKPKVEPRMQEQFDFYKQESQIIDEKTIDDAFVGEEKQLFELPKETELENVINIKEEIIIEPIQEVIRPIKQHIDVLCQVHGTYIVASDEGAMYLIDQHAAQERINYEYYQNKFLNQKMIMQDLLVPLTFEYPASVCALIDDKKHLLESIGITLINFGDNGYIVRQVPNWFKSVNEQFYIESMIDQLLEYQKIDLLELQKDAIAMISCKASIKANQYLNIRGMQGLVNDLMRCDNPYVCPHGRPTIITYKSYDLEKLFKRVM